jgi:uncharacterized protein YegP (UPF0339 family)
MRPIFRSLGFAIVLAVAAPALTTSTGCSDGTEQDVGAHREGQGTFQLFEGQDGEFYFQLLAGNGEKVLKSEGYTTKAAAKNGIESVIENGTQLDRFEVLEAQNGEFYFNLKAGNHEIIGTSETYTERASAKSAVETVMGLLENVSLADLPSSDQRFETFKGSDGYYFRLIAGNGEIVMQSEAYASKSGAEAAIETVEEHGAHAEQYQVLEAQSGQHYFRLVAPNNEIIGRSEMYASKYNARRGAETVREIIRELTSTTPSDEDVREAIEVAADGAWYTSEADYGYFYVGAELDDPDAPITEELVREKMAPFVDEDPDTDKPLADLFADQGSWDEWRRDNADCADEISAFYQEECEEQAVLDAALAANLTDIQVFYFGSYGEPGYVDGVAVSIIIVGRTPNGNLAGVRTIAIWT